MIQKSNSLIWFLVFLLGIGSILQWVCIIIWHPSRLGALIWLHLLTSLSIGAGAVGCGGRIVQTYLVVLGLLGRAVIGGDCRLHPTG